MAKVNIIFWTQGGNTSAMADAIGKGVAEAGHEANVAAVSAGSAALLSDAKAFALGCPAMGDEVLEESEMEPFVAGLEGNVPRGEPLWVAASVEPFVMGRRPKRDGGVFAREGHVGKYPRRRRRVGFHDFALVRRQRAALYRKAGVFAFVYEGESLAVGRKILFFRKRPKLLFVLVGQKARTVEPEREGAGAPERIFARGVFLRRDPSLGKVEP